MKILVVGCEPRTRALFDGLSASRLWDVTFCEDQASAERLLGSAQDAFDYVLVEPEGELPAAAGLMAARDAPQADSAAPGSATVVPLDWHRGAQVRGRRGVYGFYPLAPDPDAGENCVAEQWVFEYHAPCRRRSSR